MAQPSRLDVAVPVQDDTPGRAEIDKELLRATATTEKAEKAERADAEEKPKIPTFLDLMSGPNYPLGRALSWCGWEGRSCDIVASCEHDLRKEKLHTELMEEVVSTDLMFIGPDCQTLSGMREKPIFGHPSPPKPLRNLATSWNGRRARLGRTMQSAWGSRTAWQDLCACSLSR